MRRQEPCNAFDVVDRSLDAVARTARATVGAAIRALVYAVRKLTAITRKNRVKEVMTREY